MATFEVTRGGDTVEDTVFDVDPVVDTANPFGDYCVIKMDDSEGEKFAQYRRGTRVDVSITEDNVTTDRFTGYVVERRETEQDGADVLEVEAYSFDQFLRRNTVTNDQQGNLISEALEDIITTDTPVTYVAGNIDVGDEQELTRSYQGEAVETVLRDLAFKSNNEDFGVNDDLEFFFRERETVHIDRGIDNTQWFNYDIPELGKEAINEVEVWFDDGEESVIVDDGTDKLDLQDSLGLTDPGTQRAELNRPLLTDINDAEDEGRKYLQFRNSTLSGTVTTFGLFDAEPGDTIDIEIQPRGIDEEFVIAAIEYRWGVDETILTIVEKRGDVDDILSELNESVQRVEMEGANRDAPKNRITTTDAAAIVSISDDFEIENENVVFVDSGETLEVNSGETVGATTVENAGSVDNGGSFETTQSLNVDNTDRRFVNNGRRAVRDTWIGDDPPGIATLVVGSDGTGLSRSNDTLRNQTNSTSVSKSLLDSKTVEFTATIEQSGVQEVGLETADGRLITRVVFDDAIDINGTVSVTLDVSNDASVSRGVLTNDGQTAVRDVLADNTPALPNAYAYGSDGTAVAESDTTLGNELVETDLDEILIQSAFSTQQWQNIVSVSGDEPFSFNNDFSLSQTAFFAEWSDFSATLTDSSLEYSDGTARSLNEEGQTTSVTISPDYDIPADNVEIQLRIEVPNDNAPEVEYRFNGERIERFTLGHGTFSLRWRDFVYTGEDLSAGESYTLEVEVLNDDDGTSTDNHNLDCAVVYDNRFNHDNDGTGNDFDNTVNEDNGYLDDPALFPAALSKSFETADTRRNLTQANYVLTANDVSNEFYVELSNDGNTFTRFNNADTGSVTFAEPDAGVDTNVQLSRFGGPQEATPRFGFNGQSIDSWQLFANPDAIFSEDINATLARAIIPPNTLAPGTTIREAGLKNDGVLLTRHELAEFDVLEGQRISSSETSRFTGDN